MTDARKPEPGAPLVFQVQTEPKPASACAECRHKWQSFSLPEPWYWKCGAFAKPCDEVRKQHVKHCPGYEPRIGLLRKVGRWLW
jgi:hypothetical protein